MSVRNSILPGYGADVPANVLNVLEEGDSELGDLEAQIERAQREVPRQALPAAQDMEVEEVCAAMTCRILSCCLLVRVSRSFFSQCFSVSHALAALIPYPLPLSFLCCQSPVDAAVAVLATHPSQLLSLAPPLP